MDVSVYSPKQTKISLSMWFGDTAS